MAIELRKRVIEMLSDRPGKKFKAREIAKWICKNYPEEVREKLQLSLNLKTETDLLNQLVAEIGSNRPVWQQKHSKLRTTEGVRPRLYYWTDKTEEEEVREAENEVKIVGPVNRLSSSRESDLYDILIEFALSEQKVHAFRIDEKKASNSHGPGGNRWLFPDVVGFENLMHGLNLQVSSTIREAGDRCFKLFSFEVKRLVNRSNAREVYYQAVSNSSWANLGYLVTSEIQGVETLAELQILHAMHGIGVIELNVMEPTESQILIPARERIEIEWKLCSRLANENSDFQAFVGQLWDFLRTGKAHITPASKNGGRLKQINSNNLR